MEFPITSRLADFFSISSSKSYHVQVLSKQTVTVEVMQLKRSMYEDPEGFVFKHFNVLTNLLKNFKQYDQSLKMSALKVLLQVSEKMEPSLASFLEDEELNKEDMSKKRNMLKITVFLLCQFANAFNQDDIKKAIDSNIFKGRKKKADDEFDCSEWPEQRIKFLVIIKKFFKLPVYKLWDPPSVEPEFMNFVTITFFKLLETPEVAKDKGMRTEIFRFLGTVLKEYKTGLVFSVKILQLVQDLEHLSSVLSEGVIYFVKECSADTLISDILKEATLVDMNVLSQKLSAAHSLSQFLVSVSEECPEKFLPHVGIILQFLEWEPHVMRNFALSICGILISKPLCSVNLSAQEKNVREELLAQVLAHLLDSNSYVRCRAIQILKMLQQEKAVASVELYEIGKMISKRLKDKASNVRKNAMSFMIDFVHENELSCQVPLDVLKESYQKEMGKLKEMQRNMPVIFEESDEEEDPGAKSKPNGIIFDDSDDEMIADKAEEVVKPNSNAPETNADNNGNKSDEITSDAVKENEMNAQENNADCTQENLKKQQILVNYLKSTLNFAEVIYGVIEPIRTLLHSSTQTDILEALEFVVSLKNSAVKLSDNIMKEVLKLVRSKEATVRQAVLNTFKTLYLSNGDEDCNLSEIAVNLMDLLNGATADDALDIQECIKHFTQMKAIPACLPNVLWASITGPGSELSEEQKISVIQLFGMLTEIQPEVLVKRLDNFIEFGLDKTVEKSFLFVMHVFRTLGKVNISIRGKIAVESVCEEEIRLPHSSMLVSHLKYFLIDGIKHFSSDQWIPMANEAVATIFSLIEEPVMLCAEISKKLADILREDMHIEKNENAENTDDVTVKNISSVLYTRFLAFCGHVAVHYFTFLKVDYFAYLRRQEAVRDKRRRRSSIHTHVSSIDSPNFMSSPKAKSSKKRKTFQKKYQLVPPIDEETTYEQIMEMCANDIQNENKLVGVLLPFIIDACRWTLKVFNKEIQAAASLSLAKFMLLSEKVCEENMQLFATLAEKSPEASVRANMMVAMGDLTTSYPNIVEPWTRQIFQRLNDSDSLVRENALIILTHLILHDFVRIKSLISDVAKCIADPNPSVSKVAKYLFAELSKKGNAIYNILPDIISSLSDPNSGVNEEIFQEILGFILQYIEKERLVEGLVEKLCCRFTDSSTDIQFHELTFCLSILTLNAKCYRKLMEFKTLLKEKMSDPVVMRYITSILAHAKKNDQKTAAELEAFKKELGI